MKYRSLISLVIFIAITLVSGCASGTDQTPRPLGPIPTKNAPQIRPANVESIAIYQDHVSTLEVSVIARGFHENRCEHIDKIQQSRSNNNILVSIDSRLVLADDCGGNPVPFEQTVALSVNDLSPGTYFVEVNGLRGSFSIQASDDADPENAVISGRLWLDICRDNREDGGAEIRSDSSCIGQGDDQRKANGIMDSVESGIAEVIVNLGAGVCPSSGLASTITDGEGVFLFAGLSSGSYCVSIDSMNQQNSQQLFDGDWSVAEFEDIAEIEVELKSGQVQDGINFGWQHQEQTRIFLPREDPCTNKALFMDDVSIPDGTILLPGQVFTKTWRLRNIGSCSWGDGYTLVLVEGDTMNSLQDIPIPTVVQPGDDIELSVTLQAPTTPGIYEAAWKLRNQEAVLFGIGPGSDQAFWVKVYVEARE